MPLPANGPDRRTGQSTWIRLRTLILLRWFAVAGQGTTLVVSAVWLSLDLPLGACVLVVAASVMANLVFMVVLPPGHRLQEREALAMLCFDMLQLAALLALTGGLNNPFAVLIVAPVTIAATGLTDRSTTILGVLTLGLVSALAVVHLPLRTTEGLILEVPSLYRLGFWLSLVIGVVFLAVYARRVSSEIRSMGEGLLATQMALSREQKLTDLGGVVAAAAHELGTPLATITLVSAELMEELDGKPGLENLREDAALIRQQADRCRDILRSMGRVGKDDLLLRHAPLEAVLREAAEPHAARGKTLVFDLYGEGETAGRQPDIRRAPEVIHGLRNLIQNAVDFAQSTVWVDGVWSDMRLTVRIIDDGPGYPPHLLGRIGDPFLRARAEAPQDPGRPGYESMGLGLFIAKTLLERSGAEMSFANGTDPFLRQSERPLRSGAIVEAVWPLEALTRPKGAVLGGNVPITG